MRRPRGERRGGGAATARGDSTPFTAAPPTAAAPPAAHAGNAAAAAAPPAAAAASPAAALPAASPAPAPLSAAAMKMLGGLRRRCKRMRDERSMRHHAPTMRTPCVHHARGAGCLRGVRASGGMMVAMPMPASTCTRTSASMACSSSCSARTWVGLGARIGGLGLGLGSSNCCSARLLVGGARLQAAVDGADDAARLACQGHVQTQEQSSSSRQRSGARAARAGTCPVLGALQPRRHHLRRLLRRCLPTERRRRRVAVG